MKLRLLKQNKGKIFGILDIGSENVKFLIVEKKQEKIIILAKEIQEYDRFGVFDTRNFELDVMKKAIEKVIEQAKKQTSVTVENLVIGFAAHILKARILNQQWQRTEPEIPIAKQEKEEILKAIFKTSQEQAAKDFTKQAGILGSELCFFSTKSISSKINGYKVADILGFKGKNLEFKTLVAFFLEDYFVNIQGLIKELGFKSLKIVHESEGLVEILHKSHGALFLDIGAEFTQIFLMDNGSLDLISEFELGGKSFSEALCRHFGILYGVAKDLAKKYQTGSLEEPTRASLKEIFLKEAQNWYFHLEKQLENKAFFGKIFCFGGGAFYPEIKQVLEKNYNLPIEILQTKHMLGIEDKDSVKTNLQFISTMLLAYAI